MWLRNYYNLLTAAILADDTASSTTQPTEYSRPIMIRRPSGTWSSCNGASKPVTTISTDTAAKVALLTIGKANAVLVTSTSQTLIYSSSAVTFGIGVGSGSTAVTYDDYNLETPITSGITLVAASGTLISQTEVDSAHHVKSQRNYTINNSSNSNITISEFGIYLPFNDASNPSICLAYREVLDSPVTLAPSESFIISFSRDAEVYNYTPY